jgi:hypothetical protein
MLKKIAAVVMISVLFTGCASVNLESQEASQSAKEFAAPSAGKAGLYVYRDSFVGKALKKDVWIDGECLGETANKIFFHTEVDANKKHELSTESEFSPNVLSLYTDEGKNYFVRQYIKIGVFVGGAGLEEVTESEGKAAVSTLSLATPGGCSASK